MMNTVRSELDLTIDVLESMTDEELHAVRDVAVIMMTKKSVERPFRRLSEDEFFARIDDGLAELDAGIGEESENVDAEIASEYGLAI